MLGKPGVGRRGGVDALADLGLDRLGAEALVPVSGQIVTVERQVAEGGKGDVPGAAVHQHGHDVAPRQEGMPLIGPSAPVLVYAPHLGQDRHELVDGVHGAALAPAGLGLL